MIQLIDIEKQFQTGRQLISALRNISLTIRQNEFICIRGPSGSGKSTLLNIIGCLDQPTFGKYLLQNRDITQVSDSQLSSIRKTFGFVFQNFYLIPDLTVFENVELPFLYSEDHSCAERRVAEALKQVGLEDRLHHMPNELSGGEMQRTAIARAMVLNPKVLIADEPTGNLDSETGRTILRLFKQIHQQGTTLIMATHDQNVASYADTARYMKDGQLI